MRALEALRGAFEVFRATHLHDRLIAAQTFVNIARNWRADC